jgi:hypothetical protein
VEIQVSVVDAQLKWDAIGKFVGKKRRAVLIYGIAV